MVFELLEHLHTVNIELHECSVKFWNYSGFRPGVLRGAACLDVLKGSGARVGLPVAHYSDSIPHDSF